MLTRKDAVDDAQPSEIPTVQDQNGSYMPIKWKSSKRFDPKIVLAKIDSARTVNPNGGASFSGFDWEECQPALHSMLVFPPAANEVDQSSLVWRALTKVRGPLVPADFLSQINSELKTSLATREQDFRMLTTVSSTPGVVPATVSCLGTRIRFLKGDFPKTYASRANLIKAHPTNIPSTPNSYRRMVVALKAKSPSVAISKALRAVDLQRAVWCLIGNSTMQITFGAPSIKPINVVRLGGHHTLHLPNGKPAQEGIWFEPGFVEAAPFHFENGVLARRNAKVLLGRLLRSTYADTLVSALVRYVRAFDEADMNTAFLRLWSALESLTTPDQADYERLVRRCAFLFREVAFHRQMLEHLREYRNGSVHAGENSDNSRTICYQLQLYFRALMLFHIQNSAFFVSLDEANRFLDTPPDKDTIKRQIVLAKKAVRFIR